MSQPPGPLGLSQREQLVREIGRGLLQVVPPGWQRIRAEYRAAGRHIEADVIVTGPDGNPRPVPPPVELMQMFGQLRAGMYEAGRGTWLSAIYQIEPPAAYHVDFHPDQEPRWRRLPPPIGFQDELRFFPRTDEHIPDWLRQRAGLPPAPPPQPAPQSPGQQASTSPRGIPQQSAPAPAPTPSDGWASLRTARVYDGLNESGRPVVNRPPLAPPERERLLEYLEGAPVILAARSYDTDAFAPDEQPSVPLNFRTDGTWVWPGSVGYYLRKYELPPDPELVEHIRRKGFAVPEVPEPIKELAVAMITGQPVAGA